MQLGQFASSKENLLSQEKTQGAMEEALEEIKSVRDIVQDCVGNSLQAVSRTTEKLATDVSNEMTSLTNQVNHGPYHSTTAQHTNITPSLQLDSSYHRLTTWPGYGCTGREGRAVSGRGR